MLIASEAALWGAIHHQGLLPDTVIVSDDAGQFRVGAHALCWIHAERLVHKLVPANDKQRNAIHRQAILGVPHGRKWDVLEIRLVLGLAATGEYGRLPCRHVRLDGEIARNQRGREEDTRTLSHFIVAMALIALGAATFHGLEATAWAALSIWLGALPDPTAAMLYSLSAITSYGHSAIFLEDRWKLLGAIEAMNGLILFGLTTAFLFAAIELVRPSRRR